MPTLSSKPWKLTSGDLRTPLKVQLKQPISDDRGGVNLDWVTQFTVYAKVLSKVGTVITAGGTAVSTVLYYVYIRYRSGIVGGMRLVSGGRDTHKLFVSSISDYGLGHQWLEVFCTEVDPDGGDEDGR